MLADEQKIIARGLSVLEIEAAAILGLRKTIDQSFAALCQAILDCQGRVIVMGMGKSGHIGKKIASTLASTGTPAFFIHPAEASHGDLGMITDKDLLLALSYSGETEELLKILPRIKRLNLYIAALSGSAQSTLAQCATLHIPIDIAQEACPLGLAPTASTTALLAMGDAIAVAVLDARGFTMEDFAHSHPGGRLGRRLLLRVKDIMRVQHQIPRVSEQALLSDAILEMTEKHLGFTNIVSEQDPTLLLGVFTDGDLRRALGQGMDIHQTPIGQVMIQSFTTVSEDTLAADALAQMESLKILCMPVVDSDKRLIGSFNMHDLLKTGLL